MQVAWRVWPGCFWTGNVVVGGGVAGHHIATGGLRGEPRAVHVIAEGAGNCTGRVAVDAEGR